MKPSKHSSGSLQRYSTGTSQNYNGSQTKNNNKLITGGLKTFPWSFHTRRHTP